MLTRLFLVALALPTVSACFDRARPADHGPVTLAVHETTFAITAWNRDIRFHRISLAFDARLDPANAPPAMSTRLTSGRIIHSAVVGDTAYVLATISGESSANVGDNCSSSHRETVLAWFILPRYGNHPSPKTVRYDSCWERTTSPGLRETDGDSVWLDLTSSVRKRSAHVSYDRTRPAAGIRYAEASSEVTSASVDSAAVSAGDSIVVALDDEDPKEVWEPALLREAAEILSLPRLIRDTLTARKCSVPQVTGKLESNISRGAFFGPAAHGWAVWCSIADTSYIVVFRDDQAAPAALLRPVMAGRPSVMYRGEGYPSCSGSIERSPATEMAVVLKGKLVAIPEGALSAEEQYAPAHEGIRDSDCEFNVFRYWTGKRWVTLQPDGH